ncbi:hypothetical protein FOCC_FOCC017097 [Frankliniella occidentalis]|nr:hypothetical protein FOCC_FOCC017097 [Frankliniella occidentalis]
MASVRDARGSLQEADKLAEAAMTKRGLATLSVQGMQGIAQKLGLRSTGPPTAQLDKTPVELQIGGNKLVVMKGVTSLSMGVATADGLVAVLIPRNTPLPCKVTRTFTTASDNQEEAIIKLCLGEGVRWGDNHILGELTLAVPAAGPRGQVDIDTTFALDAGGVLTVTALERSSKEEASVTLQCESSLESARL